METEAQPSVEEGAEVKDEVKGEDVTGDEAEGAERGGSGDRDVETVEDTEVEEDQSTLQNDQGAGDSCPHEETEMNAEQDGNAGKNEGGEQREASTGETDGQSEDRVEQGDVGIEDELRRSKRTDEGDEVVSSKVTTVSFASEVQVLNEDEVEEQWTSAGGDNDQEDANEKDENTVGTDESLENKEEVVLNADNVASAAQSKSEEGERDDVAVAGDSNEHENIPVAELQSDEQEQPHEDPAEITSPLGETAAVIEKASEEVDIVTSEQNEAVESEEPLPESAPMDGAGVVTEASAGDVANMAEHSLEATKEGGEEDGHGKLDDIPVLQCQEEKLEEQVVERVEVVHRSMKSSAPEVTLEATVEDSTEQGVTEVKETVEGEENEAHENVPVLQYDEVETENPVLEAEAEVNGSLQAGAPEENVETTGIDQEHNSQEDYESGNPVQMPEDEMIGAEVNGDDDHQDNHYGIHHGGDAEQGAVDNHTCTELEANGALQDENQTFEENQGEHYQQDLTDPSETIPYETDPNLSSVNQEDVPLDGNFSEYEQQPMLASDVDPLPPIEPEVVRQDVHRLQEEQRMEGLSPIELLTQANQAHGVLPTPLRSPYHQQHPRSGSKLESTSRATSLSRVQIARIPSPPAHVKAQMSMDEERRASTRTSSRLPPSVMKMSSVMVNARKKAVKNRDASVYYEERQFHKTLTLDECINSRPPMPFDLDTPGPCRYSPRNKPLYEDNAPEYTFGMKFPERGGGGRTAYAKTWFNSDSNYSIKTRFERRWPSPNAYGSGKSMVGRKVPDKRDFPSFTMRAKTKFTISKKGSENEPGPDQYQRQRSDPLLFRRAPAFSMGAKLNRGRLFGAPEITPAPNYYNPHTNYTSRKVTYPAFTISGIRKPKSHTLGPHATL